MWGEVWWPLHQPTCYNNIMSSILLMWGCTQVQFELVGQQSSADSSPDNYLPIPSSLTAVVCPWYRSKSGSSRETKRGCWCERADDSGTSFACVYSLPSLTITTRPLISSLSEGEAMMLLAVCGMRTSLVSFSDSSVHLVTSVKSVIVKTLWNHFSLVAAKTVVKTKFWKVRGLWWVKELYNLLYIIIGCDTK